MVNPNSLLANENKQLPIREELQRKIDAGQLEPTPSPSPTFEDKLKKIQEMINSGELVIPPTPAPAPTPSWEEIQKKIYKTKEELTTDEKLKLIQEIYGINEEKPFGEEFKPLTPKETEKYNPFENSWSYEKPNSSLNYNPFENKWEYVEPGDVLKYNPFENKWSYE